MSMAHIMELEQELNQQLHADERMLLDYQIRFWKHKAWRAEQQKERIELERKEANKFVEKYKIIPQEKLDQILLEMKNEELIQAKKLAEVHMDAIGIIQFRRLSSEIDLIECIDKKIKTWKEVASNYKYYIPEEDSQTSESESESINGEN